jgi:ribosomal protein L40E
VVKTNGFSIFYAFLGVDENPFFTMRSNQFINNIYPLSPNAVTSGSDRVNSINPNFDPNQKWEDQARALLLELSKNRIFNIRNGRYDDFIAGVRDIYGESSFTCASIKGAIVVNSIDYFAASHEIGHQFGLYLGGDAFEQYNLYKTTNGMVTDGFDVIQRIPVTNAIDFMGSTMSNVWAHSSSYNFLLTKLVNRFDPELLYVSGSIYSNGTIELPTWYRIPNGYPDLEPGNTGSHAIVFLDNNGNQLSRVMFNASSIIGLDSSSDTLAFAFTIPYVNETAKVIIMRGNTVIAQRSVSTNLPIVKVLSPNGGEILNTETCDIRWQASDQDGDILTYVLLYSPDEGDSWIPLATDLTHTNYTWNSSNLSNGSDYLIKVIASDGVNTSEDISDNLFTLDSSSVQPSSINGTYSPGTKIPTNQSRGGVTQTISGVGNIVLYLVAGGLSVACVMVAGLYIHAHRKLSNLHLNTAQAQASQNNLSGNHSGKVCNKCGSNNSSTARFCKKCGRKI